MSATPVTPAQRARLVTLASQAAVATATVLVAAKLWAYWQSDSVSVLASLVDSLMDGAASLINLVAVRYSLAPADSQHRFGHGKAESIAALMQAAFIAGSGLFLVTESLSRLLRPRPLEDPALGVAVMGGAIVLTLLLQAVQRHVVRRTGSQAIAADALHYRMDLLSQTAIIAALFLAQSGWVAADAIFALGIAGYILHGAWRIGAEAIQDLLDRELDSSTRTLIIRCATAHPEVVGVHSLRSRRAGGTAIVQLHLDMDAALTLAEAHRIGDEVSDEIRAALPGTDVLIHPDPVARAAAMPLGGGDAEPTGK